MKGVEGKLVIKTLRFLNLKTRHLKAIRKLAFMGSNCRVLRPGYLILLWVGYPGLAFVTLRLRKIFCAADLAFGMNE